jgi:hypothetical protein
VRALIGKFPLVTPSRTRDGKVGLGPSRCQWEGGGDGILKLHGHGHCGFPLARPSKLRATRRCSGGTAARADPATRRPGVLRASGRADAEVYARGRPARCPRDSDSAPGRPESGVRGSLEGVALVTCKY